MLIRTLCPEFTYALMRAYPSSLVLLRLLPRSLSIKFMRCIENSLNEICPEGHIRMNAHMDVN